MADIPRVARWRQRNRDAGKQALTIWLTVEDKARLLDMAQHWHTSPSALVTEALAAYQPTRPGVPADADTRQIRLLIQELLSDQLPRMVRQALAEVGVVTETDADTVTDTKDTVTVTDTVTATPNIASVTDDVTETITESEQSHNSDVTETPVHPDLAEEVLEMLTGVSYDARRYKLGKLCPRGHEYEGTGQSLLYRRNSVCVTCDREKVAERRAARRKG